MAASSAQKDADRIFKTLVGIIGIGALAYSAYFLYALLFDFAGND
jgi:hypothetical protein